MVVMNEWNEETGGSGKKKEKRNFQSFLIGDIFVWVGKKKEEEM